MDVEFGICDICRTKSTLKRKYYYYGLKCECHSSEHFELVRHCNNCEPREPEETKVIFKTKTLREEGY